MLRINTIESGISNAPINKPKKRVQYRNGKELIFLYSLKDEKRREDIISEINQAKIENFQNIILICSVMKKTTENVYNVACITPKLKAVAASKKAINDVPQFFRFFIMWTVTTKLKDSMKR